MCMATDIIRDVLDEVFNRLDSSPSYQAEIVQIGEIRKQKGTPFHLPKRTILSIIQRTPLTENPCGPVLLDGMVVKLEDTKLDDDNLSNCKLERARSPSVDLLQLAVHQQHLSGLCGHYALHNATWLLTVLLSNEEQQRTMLGYAMSATGFWSQFFHTDRILRQHAKFRATGKVPWDDKTMKEGVLERSHLHYLLHQGGSPLLVHLKSNISSLSELTMESLDHLAEVFSRFTENNSYCHAFIVGAINHWFVVCVNKYQGCTEVVIADSRNTDIVTLTPKEIENSSLQQTSLKTDFDRWLYREGRRACLRNIRLITNCALGLWGVRQYFCQNMLGTMIRSFHQKQEEHHFAQQSSGSPMRSTDWEIPDEDCGGSGPSGDAKRELEKKERKELFFKN
mmetsp:Transcript_23890/g.47091  ORF Transcript_23890/g.47091 Transcript_23890/m.47091 type:complete len:395 (-) Transcript_23890:636-1820(-)